MAKPVTIFRGSSGVNNKIDPTRISIDFKTGIAELAEGVNVDIDDTGRIDRCKGFAATSVTSESHSMFDCGGYALFVTGTNLTVLNTDYSISAIATVTNLARTRYAKEVRQIFYCNGFEKGYVQNQVNYAWTNPTYLGPTTERTFSDPPIGHNLEIHKGRMCIAQDIEDNYGIWLSEAGKLSRFDLAHAWLPFESHVRMMKSVVNSGMYVSTNDSTYWLGGEISLMEKQFPPKIRVADYPAIEGTDLIIPGSRVGDGIQGDVAIWTLGSGKGICIGDMNGGFQNLTEGKLTYPDARYGAAIYKDGKYIVSLQA